MADFTGNLGSRMPELQAVREGNQLIPLSVQSQHEATLQDIYFPADDWVWGPMLQRHGSVYSGFESEDFMLGVFWFEMIHVFPKILDVGILVSTLQFQIDIYNSFRLEEHDLLSFTNLVDSGFSIINLPALPETLGAQSGISVTLEASPQGPPAISGTLIFEFSLYNLYIVVSGLRVVLFCFRPEQPMKEEMEFKTNILESLSGVEQRIAIRKNPRQIYDMQFKNQSWERQAIESMMFDWQSRILGIPVWYEPMILSSPASIGELVINVVSTDYKDIRVGGLAVVRTSWQTFDALEVDSFTSNTITFVSPIAHNYTSGTELYPVRRCYADNTVQGNRFLQDYGEHSFRFRVLDNDSDLADISVQDLWHGKVILYNANVVAGGRTGETFFMRIRKLDNTIGVFSQSTLWEKHLRQWSLNILLEGAQQIWEFRQLLHYLRGQQKAFYAVSSYQELSPVTTMTNGNSSMTIPNIGYTRFIRLRSPKNEIRIHLKSGVILERTIDSTVELDEEFEQLTCNSSWPYDIEPADIHLIEFIELVRITRDELEIIHEDGYQTATITVPVKGVFD